MGYPSTEGPDAINTGLPSGSFPPSPHHMGFRGARESDDRPNIGPINVKRPTTDADENPLWTMQTGVEPVANLTAVSRLVAITG